jgi:Protein of unknown function (DUF2808)
MKTLIATLLILGTTASVYASYPATVPHPEGGNQTSTNGRFGPARYSFGLHVTGRTISELTLSAPKGIHLSQSIAIVDQHGKSVDAAIALQGQVITIVFPRPIALGTTLHIDLNGVKRTDNSLSWELDASGKLDNLKESIQLQTIRMSPHYL